MVNYIIVSIVCGLIFGILDGFINANPLARKLLEVYKPIARNNINIPVGIIIDLIYGFLLTGIYIILYKSLLGNIGIIKGICFSIIIWLFRVLMYSISQWIMFNIPVKTVLYLSIAGLIEMIILGIIIGVFIKV